MKNLIHRFLFIDKPFYTTALQWLYWMMLFWIAWVAALFLLGYLRWTVVGLRLVLQPHFDWSSLFWAISFFVGAFVILRLFIEIMDALMHWLLYGQPRHSSAPSPDKN